MERIDTRSIHRIRRRSSPRSDWHDQKLIRESMRKKKVNLYADTGYMITHSIGRMSHGVAHHEPVLSSPSTDEMQG